MSIKTLRRVAVFGAIGLLSLLGTEAFLRLMVPYELAFETGFTPGIHTPDEQFGFVFTPNYEGYMRQADGVWGIRFALDQNGFRRTAVGRGSPPRRRIVMVGGMSMMMGYGLPDGRTVPGVLASTSRHPLEVHNTALAGFDLLRNWHLFLRKLDDQAFDGAILSVYGNFPDMLVHFSELPDDLSQVPAPPSEDLFYFFDNLVTDRQGPLAEVLGPALYTSYVGYRVFHAVDRRLRLMGYGRREHAQSLPRKPAGSGAQKFAALIDRVSTHFRCKGTRLLVVFLPIQSAPDTFYSPLADALPNGISYLDLHRDHHASISREPFLAVGHYGREQSRIIGSALADAIENWWE